MTLRLNVGSSIGTYTLSWGEAEVTLGSQIVHSIRSFSVFPQLCVIYLLYLLHQTGEGLAEVLQVGLSVWAAVSYRTSSAVRSKLFSNPSEDRSHEIYQMSVIHLCFMKNSSLTVYQMSYRCLKMLQVVMHPLTRSSKKYSYKQGWERRDLFGPGHIFYWFTCKDTGPQCPE